MCTLQSFALVLVFSLPLFAQESPLNERELGAYKGDDDAVGSIMNYCDSVNETIQGKQPRIFAQLRTASTTHPEKNDSWKEFASRTDWETAGKPVPLAFVWDKDNSIVRVTMVAAPPRPGTPAITHQRVDYCYATDARLVRIRAVWSVPTECEFLFPCRLISNQDFFLIHPQRPAVTDWVFTEDGEIDKLHDGKEVNDYFDPSNSLSVDDLHLRKSDELPFNHPSLTTPK